MAAIMYAGKETSSAPYSTFIDPAKHKDLINPLSKFKVKRKWGGDLRARWDYFQLKPCP